MNPSLPFLLLTILLASCTQAQESSPSYLNQLLPSTTPEIFAPGLISLPDEYEFGSVFNADVTEFFYGVDANGKSEIRYSQLVEGTWSPPKTILQHERYGYNDPFLSPDEQRLYFISQQAMDGEGESKDYDIWYVERKKNGWSDPINVGPNINTAGDEYYISFTKDGTMYFSSNKIDGNFDIYASPSRNGEFQAAIPLSDAINTPSYEADVFIDPGESYVIFCARRPEGLGRGDLYISFKNPDGSWTPSKNMGPAINSDKHELCPFVSKDGKYFFYTSDMDIYWVSTEIFQEMRE